jgi:hypothetical protein
LVNDVAETVASWVRTNLGVAVAITAVMGTILGGVVAGTLWVGSIAHLEKRVDVIRGDVTIMQGTMLENRKVVADVRRSLEASDATTRELIARLEERIKAQEKAK